VMSVADIIRNFSLSELRQLGSWFRVKHGLDITLLGGWAVYSYNAYMGSFDIDCLGPVDPFTSQLNIYMQAHGYVLEPESSLGAASETWRKPVVVGKETIGAIHIDACDFDFPNVFKENPERQIPYGLCLQNEMVRRRLVDNEYFYVPIKELLLLYKTKAARDRNYVLTHERLPNHIRQRQQGKVQKDYSDMAALIDPRHGGAIDGSQLGDLIRECDAPFVLETISGLPDQPSVSDYCLARSAEKSDLIRWVRRTVQDSGL